jgi:hypothetical protein
MSALAIVLLACGLIGALFCLAACGVSGAAEDNAAEHYKT